MRNGRFTITDESVRFAGIDPRHRERVRTACHELDDVLHRYRVVEQFLTPVVAAVECVKFLVDATAAPCVVTTNIKPCGCDVGTGEMEVHSAHCPEVTA